MKELFRLSEKQVRRVAKHFPKSCGIPCRKLWKNPILHDETLYKQRHKIENSSSKIKNWRRIAMRYDRCAHTFLSAICIAVLVTWRIN